MINSKPHIIFSIFILLLMFSHINSVEAHNSQNCTKERFYTPKRLYKSFQLAPRSSQQNQHSSDEFELSTSESSQEDDSQDFSSRAQCFLLVEQMSSWTPKLKTAEIVTGYLLNYYGVELKLFTPPPQA